MEKVLITNGQKEVEVSEKAFHVVYKAHGFVLVTEDAQVKEENEQSVSPLNELTVDELKDLAKELGLEGYSSLKKAELIELIEANDAE